MLIVTPSECVSDCLIDAVEREFPWITVTVLSTPEAAVTTLQHPASLILVDSVYLPSVASWAGALSAAHAGAHLALMQDDGGPAISIHEVRSTKLVKGVVPMNLKLDVWLSILRLILRGGEYFPVSLLQDPAATVAIEEEFRPHAGELDGLQGLTGREGQILEMVARGLQNKVIAANLRLSEHTVKIHLHHIITKLGAHNRTEAAAMFHSCQPSAGEPGPRNVPSRPS